MEIIIEYQNKSAALRASESPYTSNIHLLQNTLSKALAGVGLQLNGDIQELEK